MRSSLKSVDDARAPNITDSRFDAQADLGC